MSNEDFLKSLSTECFGAFLLGLMDLDDNEKNTKLIEKFLKEDFNAENWNREGIIKLMLGEKQNEI